MEECNGLIINNKKYMIVDEIIKDNFTYMYLSNYDNVEDFCIRKIKDENKETLLGLDDVEEFNMALKLFSEKNS